MSCTNPHCAIACKAFVRDKYTRWADVNPDSVCVAEKKIYTPAGAYVRTDVCGHAKREHTTEAAWLTEEKEAEAFVKSRETRAKALKTQQDTEAKRKEDQHKRDDQLAAVIGTEIRRIRSAEAKAQAAARVEVKRP